MKKFITLTGSILFSLLLVFIFMANSQAEKKDLKDSKSIKSEEKLYGFRFACPGGPEKFVKMKGISYDDAARKAEDQVKKDGCANPVNLFYMEGGRFCADSGNKYRLYAKLWVFDGADLNRKLDQMVIDRGFKLKCGNTSSHYEDFNVAKEREKSSKAALDNARNEVVWE